MPQVIWSPSARRDLSRLADFLAEKSPAASIRAISAIEEGVRLITQHSAAGRRALGLSDEYREWIVPFGKGAYVLFYRVSTAGITLLALRHSRELGYPISF